MTKIDLLKAGRVPSLSSRLELWIETLPTAVLF